MIVLEPRSEAPRLETERLILRAQTLGDYPAIHAMWTDPAVTRFIGDGSPRSREEIWTKFLRKSGHWVLLGFGYWTVEEKTSGSVVGEVGFGDFERDMKPSIAGDAEIGWAFATRFHGKGFATEAAQAALDWGDANFKDASMCCIIDMGNAPSIRIAEKLGFKKTDIAQYHGAEVLLFRR